MRRRVRWVDRVLPKKTSEVSEDLGSLGRFELREYAAPRRAWDRDPNRCWFVGQYAMQASPHLAGWPLPLGVPLLSELNRY